MLVMRKIMAKDVTWTMGSVSEPGRSSNEATHTVTLDRNYYIGVFEFTQTQWALIAPGMTYPRVAPSKFALEGDKAMRPVEQVSYYDIRARTNEGDTEAKTSTDYPHAPADGSFLAVLRTMTGIDFDLPLESQWEFACRAGNGEGHWGDGTPFASNLSNVPGRFADNGGMLDGGSWPTSDSTAEHGTAIVGSYAPNCWGLYDMHGNVGELVLDYYVNDISSYNGAYVPYPSPADRAHLARGGVWSGEAKLCRSADRHVVNDIAVWSGARFSEYGFRVVCYAGLD